MISFEIITFSEFKSVLFWLIIQVLSTIKISFIQYNINNNISPYIFYTYNAAKCRRDTSYVIEAYISDIKKGGTWQTVSVASKYFENGIPQIDGDRSPEVSAHTFLRNLIFNFVLENVQATSYQELLDSSVEIAQTVDLAYTAETAGKAKLNTLANIIINVIDEGLSQLPAPITNRGIVKFPGYYKLKDLLLITNTTRNTIIYNFADTASSADVTYSEFSDALKECVVSVWIDDESTFGTFPLESMKCGVPVVGKIPSTEPDWLDENGMWTYDENKIVEILGTYVLAWLDGIELTQEVKDKMRDTLLPYSSSITENNILSVFDSFKNKRVESIKNAVEKLKLEENEQ
jgi:hypothetical protein